MTTFRIEKRVFDVFPEFCVAVVTASGLDNTHVDRTIVQIMEDALAETHAKLVDTDIREHKNIRVWRDAFEKLEMNPNRFPSSIEALIKRVVKKPQLPVINNVVNITNAMAVRYLVPMGAHDMDGIDGDIEIRFTKEGEVFTPFGSTETEIVDENELVYGDAKEVRTRRWVWRQGERGKVDACTKRVFFPIDGFYGVTDSDIRMAQEALTGLLHSVFPNAAVQIGWVDKNHPEMTID